MQHLIRVDFVIDEEMAAECIRHLLSARVKPTKKRVIEICATYLKNNGERFSVEPIFELYDEIDGWVEDEKVAVWVDKIWK